jgi:hypothetical protein
MEHKTVLLKSIPGSTEDAMRQAQAYPGRPHPRPIVSRDRAHLSVQGGLLH